MDGKRLGDTLTDDMAPEPGDRTRHEQPIRHVPRDAFPTDVEVVSGVQFEARTQQDPDQVIVDGNHPPTGQTLHVAVEVLGVREATTGALSDGHVADIAVGTGAPHTSRQAALGQSAVCACRSGGRMWMWMR